MKYVKEGISFLTAPVNSFNAEKDTKLSKAFRYMLVLAIIVSVLSAIVTTVSMSFMPALAPVAGLASAPFTFVLGLVTTYILIIVVSFIWGLWLHLWAYVLGARKGMEQTLKSVFYGETPSYLLGWIPLVSFIAGIWSFVLTGMGLMRLHGITGGKAAIAIIIALLIPAIVIITFLAAILSMIMALGALPGMMPAY